MPGLDGKRAPWQEGQHSSWAEQGWGVSCMDNIFKEQQEGGLEFSKAVLWGTKQRMFPPSAGGRDKQQCPCG